jgi:hypothetical protein
MIEKAWKAIYKPLLLDKNYRAWLQITPHEILLYPFYARNNQFKIAAGITTSAELIVGAEPISRIPAPLPALKLVKTYDKNFRIALAADLYYRDIVTIASPLLLNREFVSEGKSVLLKSFDVSGSGDRIIIKLETSGSLEGTLYLTGRPQFDPQTKMFSVVDVDFDIQTRDLLVKTADWFLHGTIRSTIQEKLNVNMEQKLKETQELLQKSISRIQLLEHVFLKGSISSLKISDVVVQKEKISIQVYSEGETGIEFE